jgi:hypothetical protein
MIALVNAEFMTQQIQSLCTTEDSWRIRAWDLRILRV